MIGSLQLAAALLLVAAGLGKLRTPDPAATMLGQVWHAVPRGVAGRAAVRVFGAVEVTVAVFVCATGTRVAAALLAACYVGFLVVAGRLLVRGQRGSCGCFGDTESPVGLAHVLVNCAAVAAAAAALVRPPGPVGGLFDNDAIVGVIGLGQAVVLSYLAFLSITALPALTAARRRLMEAT